MQLTINKGGILNKTEWEYDEKTDSGDYVVTEVEEPIGVLGEECDLGEGVTLRDVFILLNKDVNLYSLILRNWTKEIVTEGLSGKTHQGDDLNIDYIELYWHIEKIIDKEDGNHLCGASFPALHGYGDWDEKTKGGISLVGLPAYSIIDLPLRIAKKTSVHTTDLDDINNRHNGPFDLGELTPTLFSLLYGVVWELSFFGSPEDRDKKSKELSDISNKVKIEMDKGDFK